MALIKLLIAPIRRIVNFPLFQLMGCSIRKRGRNAPHPARLVFGSANQRKMASSRGVGQSESLR